MTVVHGFELVREQIVPELNSTARWYRHLKTGAELLSIENDDENKCFSVAFSTPPPDNTGLPHILEHSVLCGSRKYPVKEPFIELIKGSLASFINAFTTPDRTIYPIASTNTKDFYNLIDVYLDAAFFPNITPETLQQEGWHYELDSLESELTYKGVVYNEMKGVYSSPDEKLGEVARKSLFPDTNYSVDYGGDPRHIPELTYEDFREFHAKYYHPSNAHFYFYGDDDPDQRLKMIDAVLQEFDPIAIDTEIPLQARFDSPRRLVEKYDAGETEEQKGMVIVNWMLIEDNDDERGLAFEMMAHVLMGTPASPLRKALIDSGLGEDTLGGGIDDLRQLTFAAGMKGIDPANADQVENLILDTLKTLVKDGIDPATVEASVNTTEFAMREYNTGGFPRGLALMMDIMPSWQHRHDPLFGIGYEAPLNALKTRIANGEKVFEGLIQEYLLDNPHRTTVILEPDPTFTEAWENEEQSRLNAVRSRLNDSELQQIVEDTHRLRELQETPNSPEGLATLPVLTLDDLEKQVRTVPNEILDAHGVKVLYHDLFTNGILYLDAAFNLQSLPQEYLPFVGLFSRALLEMGTAKASFIHLTQLIGSKTGGISPTTFISQKVDRTQHNAWLILRAKGTINQTPDLLEILHDILTGVNFDDRERFRQIVLKTKAGREAGLVPSGHMVVHRRLTAGFDVAGWLSEEMGGVENFFFLRNLLAEIDANWDGVRAKLEAMRDYLLNRAMMLVNVTVDGANWATVAPQINDFVGALPSGSGTLAQWTPNFNTANEGLTIPAQVNYVCKGANLYDLGYELSGAAYVVPRWLSTDWLWERVRMMGGAYGAFANFDPYSGVYDFISYRDPNLLGTLENYDGTAGYLRQLDLSDSELTKAIIGAISDIDYYQLPDAKGYSQMLRYLNGMTDERRQQIRDSVLSTSVKDFRHFGEVLAQLNAAGRIVVLGSAEAMNVANSQHPGLLNITKVQ